MNSKARRAKKERLLEFDSEIMSGSVPSGSQRKKLDKQLYS